VGASLQRWRGRFPDYGRKIAVDPEGNVVVAGDTDTNDGITGADFLIIKYSGAGIPLWTNRYNGTANGDDRAYALGVDQAGNVFVAGSSGDAIGGINYATLGYSPAGEPLWTNRYDGPANGEDVARALAVDYNGTVFVTGYSSSNGFNRAYLTIAYSGAGAPLWTNRSDGFYGEANALTVDAAGTFSSQDRPRATMRRLPTLARVSRSGQIATTAARKREPAQSGWITPAMSL
jgi:hypothetical protein